MPIAGGLHQALLLAVEAGCECVQMFLGNPRSWEMKTLHEKEIERFLEVRRGPAKDLHPIAAHMPYLPNLATEDPDFFTKSVQSLKENLQRCNALGIEYLVVHMGKGEGIKGLRRMREALYRTYEGLDNRTCLLFENTAGQGKEMGWKLEELVEFYAMCPEIKPKGLCLDTCHLFAAGYDIGKKKEIDEIANIIEKGIGIDKVKLVHLNDSLRPLGKRVDRHAELGKGEVGSRGFRCFLRHEWVQKLPCIMEVPRNNLKDDQEHLRVARSLAGIKPK